MQMQMQIKNINEKVQAINAAHSAFATIESVVPNAIPSSTKITLAELKLDLLNILGESNA